MTTYSFIEHGTVDSLVGYQVQREIFNVIKKQIDEHFPNQQNFLVNTIWITFNESNLLAAYKNFGHINNIFLCAALDEYSNNIPLPVNPNLRVFQLGNIGALGQNNYEFNASAITVSKIFKKYNDSELLLDSNSTVAYLCYQNKPHIHRQILTKTLLDNELLDKGIVTLGKYDDQEYMFSELVKLEIDEPITEYYYGSRGLTKENPYSLGDINVWRNCFLNVISESSYVSPLFITEKTYKPILGMRPFILNGNPNILQYLQEHGFYTFEEYWPNVNFRECTSIEDTTACIAIVLREVCSKSPTEISDIYTEMLPKLRHNREQFFQHAREQEHKLNHLFNT
jgi:hypothetical protein